MSGWKRGRVVVLSGKNVNGFVRSFIETTGDEVFPARNWKEALVKLKEESPEIAEA